MNSNLTKYIPENYHQDSSKSITTEDGIYDFCHFSRHESSIIQKVLKTVTLKYPSKFRAIGLANESDVIVYKARYILFDIIIILYDNSSNDYDQLAVALAYASKGALYRKEAISIFEKIQYTIPFDTLHVFSHCSPLHIFSVFSKLYEQEHMYEKAIELSTLSSQYLDSKNSSMAERIAILEEKRMNPPKIRKRKISSDQIEMEQKIRQASNNFIKKYNFNTK